MIEDVTLRLVHGLMNALGGSQTATTCDAIVTGEKFSYPTFLKTILGAKEALFNAELETCRTL